MKKKRLLTSLGIIVLVFFWIGMLCLGVFLVANIRWDKIPFFGPLLFLGFKKDVWIAPCSEPITWDELDIRPEDYPTSRHWFYSINEYSRGLLKRFMKENDLAIVPKEYILYSSMNFEQLLAELEFVPRTQ